MYRPRIYTLIALILAITLGFFVFERNEQFRLGLDLSGGTSLSYRADTSLLLEDSVRDSMEALRDVIERRIDAFGIAEPNVQTETHTLGVEGTEHRLIVELPGVTDIDEAIRLIGQTPFLEFRREAEEKEKNLITQNLENLEIQNSALLDSLTNPENQLYIPTELTGKQLKKAQVQFTQAGLGRGFESTPYISLSFDKEGAKLFEELTEANIGKTIAIYLDGSLVSNPIVRQKITGGEAIIEGGFDFEEAKRIAGRLNSGALPIPIELLSNTTIGPRLGADAVSSGIFAGMYGLILVSLILIFWYRLPGFIAVFSLGVYAIFMLSLFKFVPITLTSAGITGFIISIGIAVDANILIFERMKEERALGVPLYEALKTGFTRAWISIRDANLSSIISAFFLFSFGTSLIKGFALTFGLGILISMLTAVTLTRFFLFSLVSKNNNKKSRLLHFFYGNGIQKY